ncbi:MAG: monovalent cation/H(+) antiporter subunit G [Gammaproteobacteria bacterium]
MSPVEWLGALLLGAGSLLGVVGGIGILRFPDFYTRLHAAGVTDTLCAGLFLGGLACTFGLSLASVKLAFIFFFLLFTTPTASHALAKAARRAKLAPWQAEDQPGDRPEDQPKDQR